MNYALGLLFVAFIPASIFCLQIEPNSTELTFTSNATFTLVCTNDQPVKWIYPNSSQNDEERSSKTIENKEENKMYISTMTVRNTRYLDTGYYICESASQSESIAMKKIYIFVDDGDHLLAMVDNDFILLQPNEFGDIVIPCRPTSPDINVTLTDTDEVEITKYPFDSKIGFTIKSPKVKDNGMMKCIATRNTENGQIQDMKDIQILVNPTALGAKPYINASGAYHPVEGSNIVLNCSITVKTGAVVFVSWILPDDQIKERVIDSNQHVITIEDGNRSMKTNYKILMVRNLTKYDQGDYVCEVTDTSYSKTNTSFYLNVHDANVTFLNMNILSDSNELVEKAGKSSVQWVVNITAHPRPTVYCQRPKGKKIESNGSPNNKFFLDFDGRLAKFVINKIDINDSGTYKLVAHNEYEEKHIDLILYVQDKPKTEIKTKLAFYDFGETYEIECIVTAYPLPRVAWSAKTCNDYPTCEQSTYQPISTKNFTEISIYPHLLKSTLKFKANDTTLLVCQSENGFGTSNATLALLVSDVTNGLSISASPNEVTVGDNVTINCTASKYHYNDTISMYFNDTNSNKLIPANQLEGAEIKNENTKFSHRVSLNIINVQKNETGEYICQVVPVNEENFVHKNILINVTDVQVPKIIFTNLNKSSWRIETEKRLKMECYTQGVPKPTISWFKDEQPLQLQENNTRIVLQNDNQTLLINYVAPNDEGKFTCTAFNKGGNISVFANLILTNKPKKNEYWEFILAGSLLAAFFIICIIYLSIRTHKEKKLRKKLAEDGLLNFEEGAVNSLNPDIGVEDQADLLPYDHRYEFPREKLKLGKQLGSGAFGVVMKAEADGIIDPNTTTIVAAKMVKKGVDPLYIKALASELKIMIHLGRHLNVVNLLGACTRNINKRELVVLVEYCKYGNLHDFLLKQRNNFINQIDENTGELDFYIDVNKKCSHNNVIINGSVTSHSTSENATIEETPIGSDGYLISKDAEPDWRSNYRGDYRNTIIRPIKTSDLICWSFQIARGMEYLASRKVLHGDLAARNVLLADDNIVKICDFGLAKSMYNSENYKRRKHEMLPVRWMAVESIRDRVFSIQSDVWSFGITMWELFSLSVIPYPGVEHLETLYSKLESGYRLEKPSYATKEIYDIMLDCWHARPTLRPTFIELSEKLGVLLEAGVRSHYTNLDEMYMRMNSSMNNQVDYLALLNPPLYNIGEEPRYVNVPTKESPDVEEDIELKPMLCKTDSNYVSSKPILFINPSYVEVTKIKEATVR